MADSTAAWSTVPDCSSATFRGHAPRTVLCTGVEAEPKNRSVEVPLWMFAADFEVNKRGPTGQPQPWLYTAIFRDSTGGYPDPTFPAMVDVEWHHEVDFNVKFGYS